MSPVQTGAPPAEEAPPTRSLALRALASPILRDWQAIVALVVLAIFVFLALAGPLLVGDDPQEQVAAVFEPPSKEFPLGMDGGGANMVSSCPDSSAGGPTPC